MLPVETGAVEGGVRSVYVLGDASGGATSARPPMWRPRREKSVPVPGEGPMPSLPLRPADNEEEPTDLPSRSTRLLLLRPTDSGDTLVFGSISTMANLLLSAPPSDGVLVRRECRCVTLVPADCMSDFDPALLRDVCSWDECDAGAWGTVCVEWESEPDSEYWDE